MSRAVTCISAVALFLCLPCFAQENGTSSSGAGQDGYLALDQSAVVVLPVDVLSNESKYAGLADTVYRALLLQIATIEGIHVIDPNLVVPFTGSDSSPLDIGRQLGAATVVRSAVSAGDPGYGVKIECFDARAGKLHFSSSLHSFKRWDPGPGVAEDISDRVSSTVRSIEQSLFPDRRPDRERESDTARAIFLDSSLSEEKRVQALNDLKPPLKTGYPKQYIDDGEALSGDIAIVAAQIASESKDPGVRGSIWYTMTGVPDPVLIQPLIHSLGNDSVATVRARAAMALAAHNDDVGVQEALDSARANDPDPRVRRTAHLAASTPEGRRKLLRELAMDVEMPEQDRASALFHLFQMGGVKPEPMDEELTESMVRMAQTARKARIRQTTWFQLGTMAGPDVVDDIIGALAEEPSETVREWVVYALERKIDEPGVRTALEIAQSSDPSPLVRSTAGRALHGENQ